MVTTVIPLKKQYQVTTILLILSLIASVIPTNLLFPLSNGQISSEKGDNSNSISTTFSQIPRLMTICNDSFIGSAFRKENSSELSKKNQENNSLTKFVIGSQSGVGSGSYEAKDSAILSSNTNLDVEDGHWRSQPEEHQNSITITIPSGFTNKSGYFNINEVTALPDWRLVENETTGMTQRQSDSFYEGAQEFIVEETDLNLTKINLFIDMIDTNDMDDQKPNGEFLVVSDNSGEPNSTDVIGKITLETHPTLAGLSDGGSWSAPTNGWLQYTFSPAIHLSKGTFWFILNGTGEGGAGYWRWYTVSDGSGNPDKGEWDFKLGSHSGSWSEWPNVDMVIMPQVLPVEFISSSYVNKKYSSPQSLEFIYRTSIDDTNLASFSWFQWNGTSDNIHYFLTNTSINLTLSWRINITDLNNPLSVLSSYLTNNASITIWNLTFSTSSISTSYKIRNRTIIVDGLENDWNSSSIYLDNILEYNTSISSGLNASVTYSNQSSSMVINASSLAAAKNWKVSFDSPNYLLDFIISKEAIPLSLPYKIFNMNEYNLTFVVGDPGNLTYWIDYPNGSQVLQKNNINNAQTTITDLWNVNSTLDQTTYVNGTYNLQAFWNNSDKTKVGTYTRVVDVFINTSFSVQADSQVVVGHLFNVSAYYTCVHNSSDIQDALIFCESNWTENVYMNQIASSYYNASFNTDGRNAGETGTIIITTLLPWFVNWTQEIYVKFVRATSIEARDAINNTLLANETSTYYRRYSAAFYDNFSIYISYYDELTSSSLNMTTNPTIESDGSIFVYKKKDPVSYNWTFEFNGSMVGSFLINITFSLDNYTSSTFQIRYVISRADTAIISEIKETNIFWSNSYDFALIVNNTNYNENITLYTSDKIDINDTGKIQFLNQQGDKYWFRFAPTLLSIDIYSIKIKFFHDYLYNSSITVSFTVIARPTNIESRDALNNSLLINTTSTYSHHFSASHSDNFSIVISYYDQGTSAILNMTADPIVESDGSILIYKRKDPVSYNWTFEFNGSMVGSFLINITFSLDNYTSSTFQIRYVISRADTAIISDIKETSIFWNNSYDFALIANNTNYNENITLYTSENIDINDTGKIEFLNQQGDKYWFRFAPTVIPIGTYSFNITFSHSYLQTSFIIISFAVINRPTDIQARDALNHTLLTNVTSTYYLQYSTGHSDTVSIIIAYYDEDTGLILNTTSEPLIDIHASVLVYKTKDPVSYNWTFIFNGTMIGSFLINITFTLDNYTTATFQIQYILSQADTTVISNIVQTTFYWNDSYDFALVVNNAAYNENITLYTSPDITIDNLAIVIFLNRTTEHYWFRFAPSAVPLGIHNINITFSHVNFQTCYILFSFTVVSRPTSIEARDALNSTLLINETSTYYRQYSVGHSDIFSIILSYYDEETEAILNTISDPLVESDGSILVYSTKDPVSYNWTFIFNGTAVGNFLINITFNLDNYSVAAFQVGYILSKAVTAVISEITQTTFYWNDSYDFALVVNNTAYNENVTLYTSTEITINNQIIVEFLNRTVEHYWFRFAPSAVLIGIHDINITFSHAFFLNSSIKASFKVISRPTNIEARDTLNNTLLTNETSTYYRQYSAGHSDIFSIILSYYDEETEAILNTISDPLVESDGSILVYSIKDPVSYNWTFIFNGTVIGNFLINITFNLDNYSVAAFQVGYILSKAVTAVISEITQTTFYWNDSYDFALVVNNTAHNENVTVYTSTDIRIDNQAKVIYLNRTAEGYWFRFAPSAVPIGIHDINITFSHAFFLNSSIKASFTVISRPTNIEARDTLNNTLLTNETSTYYRQYSAGHSDIFSIILSYYDEETEAILNTISDPLVESDGSILVYSTKDPVSYNWTFIFNGTAVGNFLINITFNLDNYSVAAFQVGYILSKAVTAVISEITQTTFYWNDSYDFALVVNNTAYNENVTLYTSPDITIDNLAIVIFLNRTTERYWFRFAPSAVPIGIHDINITFSHLNFQNCSIEFSFTIINRPTGIEARDVINKTLLTNETSTYYRQYSPNNYDNFSILMKYYDSTTEQTLNVSEGEISIQKDGIITVNNWKNKTTYKWTFVFEGSVIGTYIINLTFNLANYTSITFSIRYVIVQATTKIENRSIEPVPSIINVKAEKVIEFWLIWRSVYDEPLNSSNGVMINGTDITLIETDPLTGNHTFRFTRSNLGTITYNLTFKIENYTKYEFMIRFNIFNRTMLITEVLSLPGISQLVNLSYGEIYEFNVFLNDSETLNPINASVLPTPVNIRFLDIGSEGNHSFQFNASQAGTFTNLTIVFFIQNYETLQFNISFIVALGEMILNISLSSHDNDSIIDTLQYGEVYNFLIFLNDNRTSLPISGTPISPLPTYLAFTGITAPGNHTFSFNAATVGTFASLKIIISVPNYNNFSYLITFEVQNREFLFDKSLSTHENNSIVNTLQYGDIYSFSIFLSDNRTSLPLNGTPISPLPTYLAFTGITTPGNHTFSFNATTVGTFASLKIIISLPNYNNFSYLITFEVQNREFLFDKSLSTHENNSIVDMLQYGDIHTFSIYLIDNQTGHPINGTPITPSQITFIGISSAGNHTFTYEAIEVGTFPSLTIQFTLIHYNDISFVLSFIIQYRVFAFNEELSSLSNNSEQVLHFREVYFFSIFLIDNQSENPVIITPSFIDLPDNITLEMISPNGNYTFKFIGETIDPSLSFTITFTQSYYNTATYIINFNIIPMPTYAPEIHYEDELIVGEFLIISGEEWVAFNNENVSITEIQLLNGSTPIFFSQSDVHGFLFTINIATEDFKQGIHNLTLILSSYGYENHSLSIPIVIIGRDIVITISIIPEVIKQGSEFSVLATLNYGPIVGSNSGVGADINLASLEGVEVLFILDILYENGSSITSRYTAETNATETAIITIYKKYTIAAEGIQKITVLSAATTSGKAAIQTTPADFLENHRFEKREEIDFNLFNLISLIGLLIFSSTLLVFGGLRYIKARKQKEIDLEKIISAQERPEIEIDLPPSKTDIITRPKQLQAETAKSVVSKAIDEPIAESIITDVTTWTDQFPPEFFKFKKEIKYIFNLVMNRKGRWVGQTSINYLVKNAPPEITTENLKRLFTDLPSQTIFFTRERSLIKITPEGKKLASSLQKDE